MEALQKKVGVILFVLGFFAIGFAPRVTHAATLYFSPSSGTATVGVPLTVTAVLDTSNVIANAVDASIVFPTDTLSVSSISKTGSIMALWVSDPTYSNANGTITFTGGTPRPGFTGSSLTLATITFVPKIAGTSTISFTGISVLSGDGLASELLSGLGSATFTINPAPPPPPPPPPAPPAPTPPPTIIYLPAPTPPPAPPIIPVEPVICPEPVEPPVCPTAETPEANPETPTEPDQPLTPTTPESPSPESAPLISTPGEVFGSIAGYLSPFASKVPTITPVKDATGNLTCPLPPKVEAIMSAPPVIEPIKSVAVPVAAAVFGILWLNEKMAQLSAKAVKVATKAVVKAAGKKLPPV